MKIVHLEQADRMYHQAIDGIKEYRMPTWQKRLDKARAIIAKAKGIS